MKPSELKKGMVVGAVIRGVTYRATVIDTKPGAVVGYSDDGTKQVVTYEDKIANPQGILKPNRNVLVEIETWYLGSSLSPTSFIKKELVSVSPYKLGEPSDALKAQWERTRKNAEEHDKQLTRKKKEEERVKGMLERLGLPTNLVRGHAVDVPVYVPIRELEKLVRRYEARGRKAKPKATA